MIRILSKSGESLAFADRFGPGVETSWKEDISPETTVLFDTAGMGDVAERITNPVYGAGRIHDSLEGNHDFGAKLAANVGIHTEQANGPEMSVGAFYRKGTRQRFVISSVPKGTNMACRLWKKPDPKIYKWTLLKIEPFLRQFGFNGFLACYVVVSEKGVPHFLRWVAHIEPYVFGLLGSILPMATGLEELNGHTMDYSWVFMAQLSNQCFASARHNNPQAAVRRLRRNIDGTSVVNKHFEDNLDEILKSIEKLTEHKFL